MKLSEGISFEVEPTQEIWRTPDLTFTVMYPSSNTVSIKGMRGVFTRKDYKSLLGIFYRRNYKKAIIEREVDGVLVEKVMVFNENHKTLQGKTHRRQDHLS